MAFKDDREGMIRYEEKKKRWAPKENDATAHAKRRNREGKSGGGQLARKKYKCGCLKKSKMINGIENTKDAQKDKAQQEGINAK